MATWMVLIIVFAHFVGDFFCQSQQMVDWKSNPKTKFPALLFHSFIYSVVMFLFCLTFTSISISFMLWLVTNWLAHFVVDFITSDIYKYFATKNGFKRGFFNTLGADQMIHLSILFGSFYLWMV